MRRVILRVLSHCHFSIDPCRFGDYYSFMPFAQSYIPKRNAPRIGVVFVIFIAFLIGLGLGLGQGTRASGNGSIVSGLGMSKEATIDGVGSSAPRDIARSVDFDLFWRVWNDVKSDYYKQPVSDEDLFYGAISGMMEAVGDPYTTYFPPEDAKAFEEGMKGEFSGIGAEIGRKHDALQVIAPLPETPAERAGLRAGDLILEINGEDSTEMSTTEAVSKIRGEKGTEVRLKMGRILKDANGTDQAETFEVSIVRDTIVVKSARLMDLKDGIVQIEISNFNEDAGATFDALVKEAIAKNPKGVIIDLRNNPGGYLDHATHILGAWVPGQEVVLQRRQGEIIERLKAEGNGELKDVPTIVLINEGSASASEIVAGALQDYGTAQIVGMTSFGKGSVQDYLQYEDGSSAKITISEWLTPKGRSITEEGIVPDIIIERTNEDYDAERDPQLDKAVELLTVGGRS